MDKPVLSASLKYIINFSQTQFQDNRGLHLNSKDWKSFISVGPLQYYSFLINGDLKWHTNSKISGERYIQNMKLSDYKKAESPLMLFMLLKIDEKNIIELLKSFFYLSNCRISCECKAFLYWGSKYNLTQIKSNYGMGESRFPKIRDKHNQNLVCKHLYFILEKLDSEFDKFIKNLLPYYKRYFGLNTQNSIDRVKKELGQNGLKKLIETSHKNILETKNNELIKFYENIINTNLDNLIENNNDNKLGNDDINGRNN